MAGYTPFTPYSTMPTYKPFEVPSTSGGGAWDWLGEHLGDILKFGGNVVGGYMDQRNQSQNREMSQQQFEAAMRQRQNEFNTGTAIDVQNRLNRAPVADKAQYLAMSATPPMPFQPRDYTQGINNIRGQATGGAAEQMRANADAAANYKPGMGGVDTETLKTLLARMMGGAAPTQSNGPPTGQQSPVPNAGDPNDVANRIAQAQYEPGFFPNGLPDKPSLSLVAQEWNRLYGNTPMPWALSSRQAIDWWNAYRAAYNARLQGGG